jgi:hypothetical protein
VNEAPMLPQLAKPVPPINVSSPLVPPPATSAPSAR